MRNYSVYSSIRQIKMNQLPIRRIADGTNSFVLSIRQKGKSALHFPVWIQPVQLLRRKCAAVSGIPHAALHQLFEHLLPLCGLLPGLADSAGQLCFKDTPVILQRLF